ncbi:hypothetical protein J3B02_003969 [Coemansia erecta]|uniref:NAD(P)-binding protein n=1 Tax=Coemansia asiatica TaxID=1052880 RepID=A0A9W7XMJ8_9FUNG|nr:hypothetical protein LPJ64_002173 [Coemansia asiatica]KAJ2848365.1 hypothetical protein J3B02_003969 [Coemansia erecta]KAJ2868461.1 hypothetical protein FB639_004873 [Coemansia asiatica]
MYSLDIDDSQPIVPRGFNLDTLLRYVSRIIHSPLTSYLVVNALSQRLLTSSSRQIQPKDKIAAAAALWTATTFVLPSICRLSARLVFRPTTVNWNSEIVVVTGGSHGVGLELTKRLLRANARVAIIDVNPPPDFGQQFSGLCKYYRCDITDTSNVKAIADKIRADLGDPTMLVNNAGIVVAKLLLDMSDSEVNNVIDVNLTAHFHLIRQFLPAMIACNRGHIVSIGSIVSFVGTPQASTYCASKGGVKLLHDSMRREVASRYGASGIQFSIAYPGIINTGLFRGLDLGQFFLPTLRPDSIARAVFAALESGKAREIFLPQTAGILPLLHAFSQNARTAIVNAIAGGDVAMANFSGHVKYAGKQKK